MSFTPDFIFSLANGFVLGGWGLLLFAPQREFTQKWVHSGRWSLLLSTVYLALIAANLDRLDFGAFGSLAGVSRLFSDPWFLLAGWVHYLAFDLWVGAWEVKEAARIRLPRPLLSVCLLLTFLLGPIGWLTFNGIKGIRKK